MNNKLIEHMSAFREASYTIQSITFYRGAIFGDELSLDLTFSDGIDSLHIIYMTTGSLVPTSLDAHDSSYGQVGPGVSLAFRMTCCTLYTGYPNLPRTDQGFYVHSG